MSKIQSVTFDRRLWDQTDATNWLKAHKLKPIKEVDITKHRLRYRLRDPTRFDHFVTKKTRVGIEFVIGFGCPFCSA